MWTLIYNKIEEIKRYLHNNYELITVINPLDLVQIQKIIYMNVHNIISIININDNNNNNEEEYNVWSLKIHMPSN